MRAFWAFYGFMATAFLVHVLFLLVRLKNWDHRRYRNRMRVQNHECNIRVRVDEDEK
jgi:hypothetical protein